MIAHPFAWCAGAICSDLSSTTVRALVLLVIPCSCAIPSPIMVVFGLFWSCKQLVNRTDIHISREESPLARSLSRGVSSREESPLARSLLLGVSSREESFARSLLLRGVSREESPLARSLSRGVSLARSLSRGFSLARSLSREESLLQGVSRKS